MQKFETLQQPWGFEQQWREEKKKINTKNSGLPKFAPLVKHISLGPITKNSGLPKLTTGRKHFARTKIKT
jgi:hypothetical protein